MINKFVDNVCHFFNNLPMEKICAYRIVWLNICIEKYFSNIFGKWELQLLWLRMGADSGAAQNVRLSAINATVL